MGPIVEAIKPYRAGVRVQGMTGQKVEQASDPRQHRWFSSLYPGSGLPYLHLTSVLIPPVHRPCPDIIIVVVVCATFHHRPSEGDINSPTHFVLPTPLRNRMQPVALSSAFHEDHITTSQRQLERFRFSLRLICRGRFVLHQEIPPRAQRERCNRWLVPQKSLVITMVRDAVTSGRVVIDQTKVETTACGSLCRPPQVVQASRDRPRRIPRICAGGDFGACLCVDDGVMF